MGALGDWSMGGDGIVWSRSISLDTPRSASYPQMISSESVPVRMYFP